MSDILTNFRDALDKAERIVQAYEVAHWEVSDSLAVLAATSRELYDSLTTPITELVAKLDTEQAFPPVALYDQESAVDHGVDPCKVCGSRHRDHSELDHPEHDSQEK